MMSSLSCFYMYISGRILSVYVDCTFFPFSFPFSRAKESRCDASILLLVLSLSIAWFHCISFRLVKLILSTHSLAIVVDGGVVFFETIAIKYRYQTGASDDQSTEDVYSLLL